MNQEKAKEILDNQKVWPLENILSAGQYWEAKGYLKGIEYQKKKTEGLVEAVKNYVKEKEHPVPDYLMVFSTYRVLKESLDQWEKNV